MNDKISELLINIKNAYLVKKEDLIVTQSKLKESILEKMKKEGYIKDFKVLEVDGVKKRIRIKLAYDEKGFSKITDLKRVSKLSQRIYASYKNLMPVKYGQGKIFLSTPAGILTDREAKQNKIGGEVLFKIW